jgi:hypothetical protein
LSDVCHGGGKEVLHITEFNVKCVNFRSPSKSKKSKSFKFPSKKEKREKSREKDGKEKDKEVEKEKKKEKEGKVKLKLKERKKSKHIEDATEVAGRLQVSSVTGIIISFKSSTNITSSLIHYTLKKN